MNEIYLDNFATTRVDKDIAQTAVDAMCNHYGNPSSLHFKGIEAERHLERARGQVATAMGCTSGEIFFTSGGTEANNIAIFGAAEALGRRGKRLITSATEHSSVLAPMAKLEQQGFEVCTIDPLPDGNIDIEGFINAVNDDTILVSCMLLNSEVGSISPIQELARRVKRKSKLALVHTDAVQGFCKLTNPIAKLGTDLASISGHKIHAPKGCGALYIRRGVRILPRTHGGGQEQNIRPGTQSVPLICAFGHAAEKYSQSAAENLQHVENIYEYFVNKLDNVQWACKNSPWDSTPYLCNLSVPGYRSEILLHALAERGIYVSSGSACSKGAASHVLTAMKLPRERIDSALRVTFGNTTTTAEIDIFFDALELAVNGITPARQ